MTVDATVNIFVQHGKTAGSPLAALQTDPNSQPECHGSEQRNHSPKDHALAIDIAANGSEIALETRCAASNAAAAPPSELYVDLDVLSPPPPPSAAHACIPEHAECAFCGTVGTPYTCGALVGVRLDGQDAAVHHACALWAPQVYQPQGCEEYFNLESEWRHAQNRRCVLCGSYGAAVTCTHAGCRAAYHLPCAALATDVVLDKSSFELWCPKHALQDEGDDEEEQYEVGRGGRGQQRNGRGGRDSSALDDDFYPTGSSGRPRRHAALSRKHRFQRSVGAGRERAVAAASVAAAAVAVSSERAQRPRTDWQRQGDAWVKVVPPWWCEHKTIHFANKVFRELFCGGTSALLVDADGTEWDCVVCCETRNDMRLQYTLRGQFLDYWDAAGVKPGDVLSFERNQPSPGKIRVGRYPQGRGLEEALAAAGHGNSTHSGSLSQLLGSETAAVSGGQDLGFAVPAAPAARAPRATALAYSSRSSEPQVERSSGHPNRWTQLPDGSAAKTVYKSTLAHQQCPVAGWLFRKLYGRVPAETDTAAMHDPNLGANFVFEVVYVPAANVHYISGRAFGGWMKQAGLRNGDQIRLWRDSQGVKICRMQGGGAALSAQLATGSGAFVAPLNGSGGDLSGAAAIGAPATATPVTSPPSAGALSSLTALAAAAGYAGQHGTPAIQAVLSHAAELRGQQQEQGISDSEFVQILEKRLAAAGIPLPPSPFIRKRKASEELGENAKIAATGGQGLSIPRILTSTAAAAAIKSPLVQNIGAQPLVPPLHSVAGGASAVQQQPLPGFRPIAAPSAPAHPNPAAQAQLQQALQQLLRHYQAQQPAAASSGAPSMPPPAPFRPATLPQPPQQPSSEPPNPWAAPPTAPNSGFVAAMAALGRHQWAAAEAALVVQFRAKCAIMDVSGREQAYMNVVQLQNNKESLLEFVKNIVQAVGGPTLQPPPINK